MWNIEEDTPKFVTSSANKEKFLNTIKSQAKYADDVYLAGGEPLIQPEHYTILKTMDEAGKFDNGTHFCYSTNLTSLKYKDINVLDYWSRIKRIKILVSLDEIDATRLHYARYPAELDKIVSNMRKLKNALQGETQHWTITPTWSVMNTHRMKEMMEFLRDQDLLSKTFYEKSEWEIDLLNILLMWPQHLSVSAASPEWKEILHLKLDEFENWYIDTMIPLKNVNVRDTSIKFFKNDMKRFNRAVDEPVVCDFNQTKEWYNRLDKVRGTNFSETFPELSWHPGSQ